MRIFSLSTPFPHVLDSRTFSPHSFRCRLQQLPMHARSRRTVLTSPNDDSVACWSTADQVINKNLLMAASGSEERPFNTGATSWTWTTSTTTTAGWRCTRRAPRQAPATSRPSARRPPRCAFPSRGNAACVLPQSFTDGKACGVGKPAGLLAESRLRMFAVLNLSEHHSLAEEWKCMAAQPWHERGSCRRFRVFAARWRTTGG